MTTFEKLGIKKSILEGLDEIKFSDVFPIQEVAIPELLAGKDVIGQAHTGTGKTAAFSLSILQNVTPKQGVQGLILAPTRELALQITTEVKKFAKYTGVKTATIYGGQGITIQHEALRKGVEVLVATPGRLIDHLKQGSIELDRIKYVVIDEADTMLDMGFIDDIKFILEMTPKEKVMSVFSATMPPEVMELSRKYLKNPKQLLLDSDDLSGKGIEQSFLVIKDKEKPKYLFDFINQNRNDGQSIVFCSTKNRARDVYWLLNKNKYKATVIEGDMSQSRRESSMKKFKSGEANLLVATDVASRGIDVPKVALVINYDVPTQDMSYFHRIGRTARAGGKGKAITLVSYSSVGQFEMIKKQTKVDLIDLNKKLGIEVKIPDITKIGVGRERPSSSFRRGENKFHNRNGRGSYKGRGGRSRDQYGPRRDQDKSHGKPAKLRSRW